MQCRCRVMATRVRASITVPGRLVGSWRWRAVLATTVGPLNGTHADSWEGEVAGNDFRSSRVRGEQRAWDGEVMAARERSRRVQCRLGVELVHRDVMRMWGLVSYEVRWRTRGEERRSQ